MGGPHKANGASQAASEVFAFSLDTPLLFSKAFIHITLLVPLSTFPNFLFFFDNKE